MARATARRIGTVHQMDNKRRRLLGSDFAWAVYYDLNQTFPQLLDANRRFGS